MNLKALLTLLLLSSTAQAYGPLEEGWWPDLNLDLGVMTRTDPVRDPQALGRLRLGIMYMAEPIYLTAGGLVQFSPGSPLGLGGQFEALNLWSGVSGTFGLLFEPNAFRMISGLGWGIFGIEVQLRQPFFSSVNGVPPEPPHETLLVFKIRIPVTWLFQAIQCQTGGKCKRLKPGKW